MSPRSTLFGSRTRTAVVVVLVVAVAVGGAFALGLLGTPSVTDVENRFDGVNETTTVIESNLTVSNPNPFGAALGGLTVDYAVDMNDIRMAEGTKNGVAVASGTGAVPFTTTMANERIPDWWVSHIRNDEETTLTVNADVHSSAVGATFDAPQVTRDVDTDLLSQFNSSETRPVNASAPAVSDPVLYINETRATWGTVTNETTLDVTFVVYNPKPYPIGMTEVGYEVSMNDVTLGEGATEREIVIPPGETRAIETSTQIRNENLDEWWVTHIENNQVSELEIDFSARLDLRATTVEVPLSSLDYTKTVETDIFGTKPESGTENTTSGENQSDGTAETSSTSTATPTATPTPTPTDSDDDDGGLVGGGEGTATPTTTPTPTPTPTDDGDGDGGGLVGGGDETATPTATPTDDDDDGGLLGSYRTSVQ